MSKRQRKKVVQEDFCVHNTSTRKWNRKSVIDKLLSGSRKISSSSSSQLNQLTDGWLELESDPGTFSLLIEDFGCFGAQVEEVYDLEQKFDGPVFGFIFLFKWLNNQQTDRTRNQNFLSTIYTNDRKGQSNSSHSDNNDNGCFSGGGGGVAAGSGSGDISNINDTKISIDNNKGHQRDDHKNGSYVEDDKIVKEIFFAKQMISNSCATHALISILLNCDHDGLNLGPTLTRLKEHTKIMDPENKGYAIGNVPELAKAHNSHANFSSLYGRNKPSSQARGVSFVIRGNQRTNLQQLKLHETYHFVSYIPINNRLYELDGLKNFPIDHGPLDPNEDWTEKFRRVIKQRLLDNSDDRSLSDDIRYNLMAVVPDKRISLGSQLRKLKSHLERTQTTIKQIKRQVMACDHGHGSFNYQQPFSPISNGTLTASEAGSICNSPKHNVHHETDQHNCHPDIYTEIPRPPYSPLSNDTLSASETGSVCNSPNRNSHLDDSFIYDEPDKVEKLFIIKFGSQEALINTNELTAPPTTASKLTPSTTSLKDYSYMALNDLKLLSSQIKRDIEKLESSLKEEHDKRRKYKLDNSRRTHNYEPFIMTFLSLLAKHGNLADLIEKDLGLVQDESESTSATTTTTTTNNNNTTTTSSMVSKPSHTPKTSSQPPSLSSSTVTRKPGTVGRPPKAKVKITPSRTSPPPPPKPKYKYVSTGRPRGRPRKNPNPNP